MHSSYTIINRMNDTKEEPPTKKVTIEQVKAKYENQLLNIEGVEGVGIGKEKGKPVIKIYIIRKTKELQKKIPAHLEDYPLSIEVTGEFHVYD